MENSKFVRILEAVNTHSRIQRPCWGLFFNALDRKIEPPVRAEGREHYITAVKRKKTECALRAEGTKALCVAFVWGVRLC